MLLRAGEVVLENRLTATRNQHRMKVCFLPDRKTLDYRAQRGAAQAWAIGRRDGPVVWRRGLRSATASRASTRRRHAGTIAANTTSSVNRMIYSSAS